MLEGLCGKTKEKEKQSSHLLVNRSHHVKKQSEQKDVKDAVRLAIVILNAKNFKIDEKH